MKCNKCNIEKDDSEFKRPGRVCRECKNKYQRLLNKRPDLKEKHRIYMNKWRAENPDKAKLISKRNWANHKDSFNEKRKHRYKNDADYRKKSIEYDKKYNTSGRRKELYVKHAAKLRKVSAQWKKDNKQWVKIYVRQYKDRYWIEHERQQRKKLDDAYVIKVIKKSMDYHLKTEDIPKELIEIYRTKIIIHRSLKQVL